MVTGIERLRAAAGLLRQAGDGRADRDAALSAAAEVWSAIGAGLDEWSWQLQAKAVPLQFHLVRHGAPAATVRRLAEPELTELRRELLEFVEAAEHLDGVFAGHTGGVSPETEE